MERLLNWFGRRRWVTLGLITAAMAANILAHEAVQVPIIELRQAISPLVFRLVMGFGGFLALAALVVWLARQPERDPYQTLKRAYLGLAVTLAALSYVFLIVADSELVHFPQYGLLLFPVFALTRSFGESVVWVTLLGSVDEAYQYGVRHADWGIPFDFNDVILNLVGAGLACAVVLSLSRLSPGSPGRESLRRPGYVLIAGLFALAAGLFATGHLVVRYLGEGPAPLIALSRMAEQTFWFFDPTWGNKPFHLLHPAEGTVLAVLLTAVYAFVDTRVSLPHRPEPIQVSPGRESPPPYGR